MRSPWESWNFDRVHRNPWVPHGDSIGPNQTHGSPMDFSWCSWKPMNSTWGFHWPESNPWVAHGLFIGVMETHEFHMGDSIGLNQTHGSPMDFSWCSWKPMNSTWGFHRPESNPWVAMDFSWCSWKPMSFTWGFRWLVLNPWVAHGLLMGFMETHELHIEFIFICLVWSNESTIEFLLGRWEFHFFDPMGFSWCDKFHGSPMGLS